MCGEKVQTLLYTDVQKGSPPRMRGKVIVDLVLTERHRIPPHVRGKGGDLSGRVSPDRITPACAGKRVLHVLLRLFRGDHPRMCGEKRNSRSSRQCNRGSPPHVRGKGCLPALALGHVGITPACAGKRFTASATTSGNRDHPRMCGEKFLLSLFICQDMGSPPHVRGKGQSLP